MIVLLSCVCVDNVQGNLLCGPLLCYYTIPFPVWVSVCFGFTWFLRIATHKRSHSVEYCCLATEMILGLHFYAVFYNIIAVMWELNVTSKCFMDQLYSSLTIIIIIVHVVSHRSRKAKVLIFLKPGKCSVLWCVILKEIENKMEWNGWKRKKERKREKRWSALHPIGIPN